MSIFGGFKRLPSPTPEERAAELARKVKATLDEKLEAEKAAIQAAAARELRLRNRVSNAPLESKVSELVSRERSLVHREDYPHLAIDLGFCDDLRYYAKECKERPDECPAKAESQLRAMYNTSVRDYDGRRVDADGVLGLASLLLPPRFYRGITGVGELFHDARVGNRFCDLYMTHLKQYALRYPYEKTSGSGDTFCALITFSTSRLSGVGMFTGDTDDMCADSIPGDTCVRRSLTAAALMMSRHGMHALSSALSSKLVNEVRWLADDGTSWADYARCIEDVCFFRQKSLALKLRGNDIYTNEYEIEDPFVWSRTSAPRSTLEGLPDEVAQAILSLQEANQGVPGVDA